jgi:hypothetical protein
VLRSALACLIAVACIAPACPAAEPAATAGPRVEPLTRGRGTAIVANADSITDELERYVAAPKSPRDEAILDDVRGVMAHAPEWRWYYRDHGILLAIPTSERLGFGTEANAEELIGDVVRRLIYQRGWGNPPVQVVFIEPEIPCHDRGTFRGTCAESQAVASDVACGCR